MTENTINCDNNRNKDDYEAVIKEIWNQNSFCTQHGTHTHSGCTALNNASH